MTSKGTIGRGLWRGLRALLMSAFGAWLQSKGIGIPVEGADAAGAALNTGIVMGLDKMLRDKWGDIKAWIFDRPWFKGP